MLLGSNEYPYFCRGIKRNGVNAGWLDARRVIKTDSTFGNAVPELETIQKKAAAFIDKNSVLLTQGFIGSFLVQQLH